MPPYGEPNPIVPQQPIPQVQQVGPEQYFIPNKEILIGFGDQVITEKKVAMPAGNPLSPYFWLRAQVEEICSLARSV